MRRRSWIGARGDGVGARRSGWLRCVSVVVVVQFWSWVSLGRVGRFVGLSALLAWSVWAEESECWLRIAEWLMGWDVG